MQITISITPMSLKNGVVGLPIICCREWNAFNSVSGKLEYAGVTAPITCSPKHVDIVNKKASAWQFTINNSVQFSQLKMDGAGTYVEGKNIGEKLVCEISTDVDANGNTTCFIKVTALEAKEETAALKKIKSLLKQGIREYSEKDDAPLWNSPSSWIDYSEIESYKDITDCLYIWKASGLSSDDKNTYIYVGIVGASSKEGKSKRTLSQRLKEEAKKYLKEYSVKIDKFRFCSLNNPNGYHVPTLLKTIEMSEITVMTSLFRCANARDNISALFEDLNIVLLNKSTSYKYVE